MSVFFGEKKYPNPPTPQLLSSTVTAGGVLLDAMLEAETPSIVKNCLKVLKEVSKKKHGVEKTKSAIWALFSSISRVNFSNVDLISKVFHEAIGDLRSTGSKSEKLDIITFLKAAFDNFPTNLTFPHVLKTMPEVSERRAACGDPQQKIHNKLTNQNNSQVAKCASTDWFKLAKECVNVFGAICDSFDMSSTSNNSNSNSSSR